MAIKCLRPNDSLLIDVSCLCYRSLFSMSNSLSNNEKPVFIIFGFLDQIRKLAEDLQSDDFCFCFDSKKSYRKIVYPTYKEKRHSDMTQDQRMALNACQEQILQLYDDVLPAMGFTRLFKQTGLEADDHLASIPANNIGNWTMVTSDEDMYQSLTDCVQIFNPTKKLFYTKKDFIQEFGVEPAVWASVKAIGGCTSDVVKGIEGVGVGKAIKYLRKEMNPKTDTYKRIEEGTDIIQRNRGLVTLPHAKHRPIVLHDYPQPALRLMDFENVFHDFSFNSFLKTDAWKKWVAAFRF